MAQYDAFASGWDQTRQRPWPEFDLLSPLVEKGDRVLDMGCGNGRLRKYITEEKVREGDFFGFDISASLVDIARGTFPKDHWFVGDMGKTLPFGADQFHVVASIASYHHLLSFRSQLEHLQELERVCRPGGKIFVTTWILPRRWFWFNFWQGRTLSGNWNVPFGPERYPRYYRQTPLRVLRKQARKAGLRIIGEKLYSGRNRVIILEK